MVNFSTTVVNDEYNPVSAIAQYIQSNVKQEHSKEGFFSVVFMSEQAMWGTAIQTVGHGLSEAPITYWNNNKVIAEGRL
jgi:hypothetical protein